MLDMVLNAPLNVYLNNFHIGIFQKLTNGVASATQW